MPNHYIVQHGLDAFQTLPGYIWRIDKSEVPHRFDEVNKGDLWIEYAYIRDEADFEPCSIITGFYKCVRRRWYGAVPIDAATLRERDYWVFLTPGIAWMIAGIAYQEQPPKEVEVPSIEELLGRPYFRNQAIVPITPEEFGTRQKESPWRRPKRRRGVARRRA